MPHHHCIIFTASSLHPASPFHHYIATATSPHHHYIITVYHSSVPSPLHHFIITLPYLHNHCIVAASPLQQPPTSLHRHSTSLSITPSSLHHPSSLLHHYIITPSIITVLPLQFISPSLHHLHHHCIIITSLHHSLQQGEAS